MSDSVEMPAFVFADGALRIHTLRTEMRIQWRPRPLAEELIPGARRWSVFWPEFRLIRPLDAPERSHAYAPDIHLDDPTQELAEQKAAAFSAFRQEVPSEMVSVVEPFGSHQWALLLLLDEQPRSIDLALSNPVLAYCLANNDQFRSTRIDAASFQAICYSHRKQRIVLEWLDFPGTEAMARLMRKIPPECAHPSILRRLRNAGKADSRAYDMLTHLPAINAAVLELVTYPQLIDLITPKFLLEAAGTETEPGTPTPADMILSALGILRTVAPRRAVRPFTTIQEAALFQREVDAEYHAYLLRQRQEQPAPVARRGRRQYPLPPVPGTPDIIPLTTAEQLRAEGREQCNCVGGYVARVMKGATYIYRITAPERATLAIIRSSDGCWYRSELKARRNASVYAETARAVDIWLASHRVSV